MAPSLQQLLIVLVIVLVLFGGRGRISSIMGDMAKGIRSFKKGLAEDDEGEDAKKPSTARLDQSSPGATMQGDARPVDDHAKSS
ncbi:putative sec-independent protein translocase protein tatA/E [Parvularcula bermudensis HTCC2503]|uniref:Sec-independent protein translocase protein TatA n=1 Tax=Parvularcula bermudensis (strain ATCC BAA-594 / HTCC2503 / KCTC 12087) TaxID=314260 RepID=E0TEB8_PARBH|nr:twin-arginine translocase TatA/TatE family subunit [Parvularcula bermudensis]ADM09493.1 putative sec-independent protein translocase protein tatA/E [Parvularcula bermudensis HTCC2503]